jgi:hypothetical protein
MAIFRVRWGIWRGPKGGEGGRAAISKVASRTRTRPENTPGARARRRSAAFGQENSHSFGVGKGAKNGPLAAGWPGFAPAARGVAGRRAASRPLRGVRQ